MDVQIRCICPETPHPSDTVSLPDTLTFRQTLTVRQYIAHESRGDESWTEYLVLALEACILHCGLSWSLTEDGKPIPASKAEIRARLMSDENMDVVEKVGDEAVTLYSGKVFLPLLNGASSSSPGTPTAGSTSRTPGSMPQKKRSKRSSTTTSLMAVTGPMAASPGGVSSSSQN